jgi:hypothetical protein
MRFVMYGLVALAACASPVSQAQTSLSSRPALDFSGTASSSGMGEDSPFARSVAARYGGLNAAAIIADARAQGFECLADQSSCTRAIMEEPCVIGWIVDVEPSGAASGRHVKRCMGAEE